jgi:hypothetical protein
MGLRSARNTVGTRCLKQKADLSVANCLCYDALVVIFKGKASRDFGDLKISCTQFAWYILFEIAAFKTFSNVIGPEKVLSLILSAIENPVTVYSE